MDKPISIEHGQAISSLKSFCKTDWLRYTQHGFVKALEDGSLAEENFVFYLKQDYLFLIQFAKAWALAVYKANTNEEMQFSLSRLNTILQGEIQLHIEFCAQKGISENELFNTEEEAGNIAYTRYVLDCAQRGDYIDLLSVLAPCIIGYGDIGSRLVKNTHASGKYQPWIQTYGSEEYQLSCREYGLHFEQSLITRLGSNYQSNPRWQTICQQFSTATKLESNFWQMGLTFKPS